MLQKKRNKILGFFLTGALLCSLVGCAGERTQIRQPVETTWQPAAGETAADSWGLAAQEKQAKEMTLQDTFSSETDSILMSQVGYSRYGYKAIYIRSTRDPGEGAYYGEFTLTDSGGSQEVYRGKLVYWGTLWDSYWWVADFSDFQEDGEYVLQIQGAKETLCSDAFTISQRALTDASLQMVLFDQLDARRSPGKLGWRDSSTDLLREIQANILALEALCDVYDHIYDTLSAENQAKVLDNIRFGCEYLLALQEKTDDPLTNGRFRHDLYDTIYSAPLIRNFYDTVNAMATLARCYGVMKNHDEVLAQTYKEAFELSYELCVLRPYYLPSEFTLETPQGLTNTTRAARIRYGINSMLWEFPSSLRTRDRLMFMRACTEMYKSSGEEHYMEQAAVLAGQIADRQYTDYQNAIDGCYGMFREFDNSETAFMIDWLQSFGQNLGCIQPTDLEPFMDLIAYDPEGENAARWHNVIHTFAEGYVKNSAKLTALGIYPVGAYAQKDYGGVKFFQSISHGANNLYGLMGRNMTILGNYLNDASLQELAQRNTQFVVGLNPGIPNAYEATKWTPTSFIYGLGKHSFAATSGKAPLGSGINGFTAAPQFTEEGIQQNRDLPLGILNKDGSFQFNEDYLPHSMGYISAAVCTEAPYTLTVKTLSGGAGAAAELQVRANGEVIGSYQTSPEGDLVLTDLPLGETVTLELRSASGVITRRTIGVVGGGSDSWTVDFEHLLRLRASAPYELTDGQGTASILLQNTGSKAITVELKLLADGVELETNQLTQELAPGEEQVLSVAIASPGTVKPYVLMIYAEYDGYETAVSLEGLAG